jgi:N-sulfoglucosamine sulfohydrolase
MYRTCLLFCLALVSGTVGLSSLPVAAAPRPNLLLITVDDMNADSIGAYGSAVPGITPNIDQLADEGLRFERAHVQVANCTPSRNVMWSGRYPHTNKVEGFRQVRDPGYEILPDLLRTAGYFTAIRNKVHSSTPFYPYVWDMVLDETPDGVRLNNKDPQSYGLSTKQGIDAATKAGKPFALMLNISDPHVPLYGINKTGDAVEDPFKPSRIYRPEEIVVPGFLVEDPVIRRELSHYYSSVRRADDAVGFILRALQGSGKSEDTLVMFISDHGMPFPFAKTQLYHHSTWTPLIFRWPDVVNEKSVDNVHMVSAVDVLPTLLEAVAEQLPQGLQGRSFLPLLKGESQVGRDRVFKEYNENSSGDRAPMRAVQDFRFLYIFNPWSNGSRSMTSATFHTSSFKRMTELAKKDENVAQRMQLLRHRVVEEFYDIRNDPDCLVNLIAEPRYKKEIRDMQSLLEDHMRETQDPVLDVFVNRADQDVLEAYMRQQNAEVRNRRVYMRAIGKALKKSKLNTSKPPVDTAK